MSGYPRRTTLTRLCPEDYEMKEGIAVLNDEVVSAINNPSVVQLLEHDISLLTLFGTSECRLNKQIKSLAYAASCERLSVFKLLSFFFSSMRQKTV